MAGQDGSGGPASQEPARRGFLKLTALVVGILGAMVAIPLVPFFAAPILRSGREEHWVPIGPVDEFDDTPRPVEYPYPHTDGWYTSGEVRQVVVGKAGGQFRILSTECTHVGCAVTWDAAEQVFLCPCHGGKFDAEGKVLVGPPREPLKRLENRVNNGMLEVKET